MEISIRLAEVWKIPWRARALIKIQRGKFRVLLSLSPQIKHKFALRQKPDQESPRYVPLFRFIWSWERRVKGEGKREREVRAVGKFSVVVANGIRESGYEKRKDAGVARVVNTKRSRRERITVRYLRSREGNPHTRGIPFPPVFNAYTRETRESKEG